MFLFNFINYLLIKPQEDVFRSLDQLALTVFLMNGWPM
ncbi:hypothetical protein EV14_2954 [Prochlorococcus sp. MIT 0703]|nr:hypothetical protein EV12_2531 [Prochlorococcus sp. MIT 0701]KGG31013.1 hypothetical protein EV14_2954 [Prochlorococcus sp. MIT 0703]